MSGTLEGLSWLKAPKAGQNRKMAMESKRVEALKLEKKYGFSKRGDSKNYFMAVKLSP
jgi:hypothetical protein